MVSERINFVQIGLKVVQIEQESIKLLSSSLNESFQYACEMIMQCSGRVVVIGMGKSGHIGRKIAATFASTGTPSFFVHPAEACHGDLGMLTTQDVILAISYSGETEEIISLLPLIKLYHIPLIAMTGNPDASLSKAATCHLSINVSQEACPLGLAPTASTTASLVMGDALAISLLQARGFSTEDFARFHPSGSLGKRLLLRVDDIMHKDEDMPRVSPNSSISTALLEITQKRLGMTTVLDDHHKLLGVFTDGDLRRTLSKGLDIHTTVIKDVMSTQCTNVTPNLLASNALFIMRSKKITALPVIDENMTTVGVIHLHDLLKAGVA